MKPAEKNVVLSLVMLLLAQAAMVSKHDPLTGMSHPVGSWLYRLASPLLSFIDWMQEAHSIIKNI